MSEAARKRESKRQQFIWTTITNMKAMADELGDENSFLALDKEQVEHVRQEARRLLVLTQSWMIAAAKEGE